MTTEEVDEDEDKNEDEEENQNNEPEIRPPKVSLLTDHLTEIQNLELQNKNNKPPEKFIVRDAIDESFELTCAATKNDDNFYPFDEEKLYFEQNQKVSYHGHFLNFE